MHKRMTIALAALTLVAAGACNQDPTGAGTNELVLAQDAQSIADNVAATSGGGTTCEGWLRRLLDTLRTTDNAVARAYLDSARANRDSAWAAFHAGDADPASARGAYPVREPRPRYDGRWRDGSCRLLRLQRLFVDGGWDILS